MRFTRSVAFAVPAIVLGYALAASASPKPSEVQKTRATAPEVAKLQAAMSKADTLFQIGKVVSDFSLTDTEGTEHRLSEYLAQGKVVVLEWFNPDCPFVKKHHMLTSSMADTYRLAKEKGVVWLAINSGAPGKQGYGLERNQKARTEYKIAYPILLDEKGEVGLKFEAKTTPHMYIISPEGTLLYRGAIDDAPDTKTLGEHNYVREALSLYFAGNPIETADTKSYGCSVKYGTP